VRKLRYSSAAREDLENIATYISEQSGSRATAAKFTSDLRSKCRDLAGLEAIIGRPRPELRHDLRSFPFGSYVIFFRYLEDTFEIVNIIEAHRDLDAIFDKD
jgi:plasmid stabilization system protein ParE